MILKISRKMIAIDENLMKSIHFVSKVIHSTVQKSHWWLIDIDVPQSNKNNFCYKKLCFHVIFINLNFCQFAGNF